MSEETYLLVAAVVCITTFGVTYYLGGPKLAFVADDGAPMAIGWILLSLGWILTVPLVATTGIAHLARAKRLAAIERRRSVQAEVEGIDRELGL